jgi:hypothetical protein
VVVKNCQKDDPKYRQLKLDNEKVRSKIARFPSAIFYLKAIGFEQEEMTLSIASVDTATMQAHYELVCKIMDQPNKKAKLEPRLTEKQKARLLIEEKERKEKEATRKLRRKPSDLSTKSEKQKARELMAEKERKDKDEAKRHREKNVALIKQDKYVRENDENWTSGVSAACDKSGTSIETFRDRHGEQ